MRKWKDLSGTYLSSVLLAGVLLLGAASKVEGITLPPGFSDTAVADVASPTALAFTPDGRLLIAEKPGRLWVYQNGVLSPTPALDLTGRICTDRERGLLGVAVDPGFAVTPYVYLYYTAGNAGSCVNRVSRFVLSEGNVLSDELVLVDNMPSPNWQSQRRRPAFRQRRLLVRQRRRRRVRLCGSYQLRWLERYRTRSACPRRQGPAHHLDR